MVREIEDGKQGRVTDVVLALRCVTDQGIQIRTIYTGRSDMATLGQMIDYLKKEAVGG